MSPGLHPTGSHWLENELVALAVDGDLVLTLEAEFLRKANGLAVLVLEELCPAHHGLILA